jgi:hypothetical protein
LQVAAANALAIPDLLRKRVTTWISLAYARYGIEAAGHVPEPFSADGLATEARYDEIKAYDIPASVQRFLLGAECVAAAACGLEPAPPYAWLSHEPTAEEVRNRKLQSTIERRIIRWQPQWNVAQEPVWP